MDVQITVVDEGALPDTWRRDIGALLRQGFPRWQGDPTEHGYLQREPAFRVVALDGRSVVANQSGLCVHAPNPLVWGLGDLVVAPAARRQGLARRLIAGAIEECVARGAEALLTSTSHPAVRSVFLELGFEPVTSDLLGVAGQPEWNPGWLARPVERLRDAGGIGIAGPF